MVTQIDEELESLLPSTPATRNKKIWYKTASSYWILPVYMLVSIANGLGATPKVQFYLRAICHDYYAKKSQFPFSSANSIFDGDFPDECNNADVQATTSQFIMILTLLSAIPSVFVLGPLGSLSDRKGRKIFMLVATTGAILGILNILLVGNFLETLGLRFLLVGSLLEGISGDFLSLTAASFAYVTDCTPPAQRSVMFGWIQGALFIGLAIGPMMGGWIVEVTNNLLSVFYVTFIAHIIFFLFFLFILPESLTKENLSENLNRQQELNSTISTGSWFSSLFSLVYSVYKPLTIFFPSNSVASNGDVATKYSLLLLAIINTLLSVALMGVRSVYLLYTTLVFEWTLLEQGYGIFLLCTSRVFVLTVLFPLLLSKFKKPILSKNDNGEQIVIENINSNEKRKVFIFEVWVVRLSFLIDVFAFIGYGLATSGSMFIGAAVIASLGSVSNPTIKSLQTSLVAPSQIGQLLGAIGVLDSLTRIISPIIFNSLYSILVLTSPNLIWYGISAILAIACLFSFGITPNKHNIYL